MIRVLLGLAIAAIASSTASAQYINPMGIQATQRMNQMLIQQQQWHAWQYRVNPQYRAEVNFQEQMRMFDRMNAQTGTIQLSGTNDYLKYEIGGLGGITIKDDIHRPIMTFRPDNSPLPRRFVP